MSRLPTGCPRDAGIVYTPSVMTPFRRWLARLARPLCLVALASAAAAGCRPPAEGAATRPTLRVATAFAPFSTRLTEEYRRAMPELDIQEQDASASAPVLRQIEAGTLDFGVVLADDAYRAYFGSGQADAAPSSSAVRAISLLQPLPIYLLARAGSGVHRIEDLKGKVVAAGPGKRLENGKRADMSVSVGDTVVYGKYAGTEVEIKGEKHLIIRESELLGVVQG